MDAHTGGLESLDQVQSGIVQESGTLEKIALLVYNMQSRACQPHESRKANFRIFKANAVPL